MTSQLSSAPSSAAITSSRAVDNLAVRTSGVFVSRLMVTNFRSYASVRVMPEAGAPLVILTGENGAGKTNILEAISYAAPGRGLRGASLEDVKKQGADSWSVAMTLSLREGSGAPDVPSEDVRVGTGLEARTPLQADNDESTAGNSRRLVKIDGELVSNTSALGDRWSVSWLTPQMDRLFIEGPSSRRRFLDRMTLGLYPDHSRQVSAYERSMRDRNKLLSDQGLRADAAWLSALEARMAEHAVAVAVARLEFAGQIAGQIAASPDTAFPKAELALDGELEAILLDGAAPVEAETIYRDMLRDQRALDAKIGRTSTGPHKTDFVVTHAPKCMRADLCSTGEQKALLVGLILANARLQTGLRGRAPLMLMDEVAAHLDHDRRHALFAALAGLGSQCWLTGTDISLFSGLKETSEFFNVADGQIQPAPFS